MFTFTQDGFWINLRPPAFVGWESERTGKSTDLLLAAGFFTSETAEFLAGYPRRQPGFPPLRAKICS
jgi:hypothetical protein